MSEAEIIKALTRKISSAIRVAMPATIEEYDFKTQKASVKIDMRELYEDGSSLDYPVLTNLPVIFPRSGGASITMPVLRGDSCVVFFADRDISNWLLGSSNQAPKTIRIHSLNDAVAIMGLSRFTKQSAAKNNTDLLIDYAGSEITLKPNGIIDLNAAKQLNIKTEEIAIECNGASIKASKSINVESAEQLNIKAKDVVINCTNANIKASGEIKTESPVFTQKGKMKIEGDIEITGSSLLKGAAKLESNIEVSGSSLLKGRAKLESNIDVAGSSALKGNVTCNATIKGATIKTSAGIDLARHKHSYKEAQAGSNPTIVIPSITGTGV